MVVLTLAFKSDNFFFFFFFDDFCPNFIITVYDLVLSMSNTKMWFQNHHKLDIHAQIKINVIHETMMIIKIVVFILIYGLKTKLIYHQTLWRHKTDFCYSYEIIVNFDLIRAWWCVYNKIKFKRY